MPELPEVEVVRLFLQSRLTGKTITGIQVLNPRSFIGDPKKIIGARLISFSRLGKQLSIHLSNELILLFHLKMTGQLIYVPLVKGGSRGISSKSTRVIIKLKLCPSLFKGGDRSGFRSKEGVLYFNDPRKFGWIKILTRKQLSQFQKNLGFDIFDPKFTPNYLYKQLRSTTRAIKLTLLDQSKFAGIGNIYANDALFIAKINPQAKSSIISRSKSQKLHHALLQIMTESVTHGGSTAKDNKYLLPDGTKGSHQFHFQVYQRDEQPCRLCHTKITRLTLGGRGTFFCPHCQKS
jgi:formamidopyrimidine-DNA glycosylase